MRTDIRAIQEIIRVVDVAASNSELRTDGIAGVTGDALIRLCTNWSGERIGDVRDAYGCSWPL